MGKRLLFVDRAGMIAEVGVRRPAAPRTLNKWLKQADRTAGWERADRYAFRYFDRWHVFLVGFRPPVKVFAPDTSQDVVEMYLLMMRSTDHG